MYVGFLAPLVPADLLDLVFRGVDGNMMVVLAGDACSGGGFWCRDGVAAKFVDIRERWMNLGCRGRVKERKKSVGQGGVVFGKGEIVGTLVRFWMRRVVHSGLSRRDSDWTCIHSYFFVIFCSFAVGRGGRATFKS
jgi:hypothetical protein